MRWFAPIVIVALVVAGSVRPAQATRTDERASMSASTDSARATAKVRESNGTTKLAPRRVAGRTTVSDRRSDLDEIFVVPRVVELVVIPTLSLIAVPLLACPCFAPAPIDEVARGPPIRVVLSNPS